jgi:hypothetical protein
MRRLATNIDLSKEGMTVRHGQQSLFYLTAVPRSFSIDMKERGYSPAGYRCIDP